MDDLEQNKDVNQVPVVGRTTKYKFMTNILSESRHRTQYIKSLEKIVPDPRIPIIRIVAAIILLALLVIFVGYTLFSDSLKLKYILIPTLLLGFSGIFLIFIYLLPSYEKSMLESSYELISFIINEKIRRKSGINGDLTSFGIESITDGICLMENGDYGLVYEIEGQLSASTLPSVADAVADVKDRYYVSRNSTCYTFTIMSIKRTDLSNQLDNLNNLMNIQTNEKQINDDWRVSMAKINYDYLNDEIKNRDMSIYQLIILCDTSINSLIKSKDAFELSAANGMFSRCIYLPEEKMICEKLHTLTSLSKKGVEKENGKKEEKSYEKKQ